MKWRDIKGYEGMYQVSDEGEVRAVRSLRILKPWTQRSGYLNVGLSKGGGRKLHAVHRLVLKAFVGEPTEGQECCHNDGDPSNNHPDNLRWGTHTENQADRIPHGTDSRGERSGMSKLTETHVLEIRALYSTGRYTKKALGELYGVCRGNIGHIVNRITWKHI